MFAVVVQSVWQRQEIQLVFPWLEHVSRATGIEMCYSHQVVPSLDAVSFDANTQVI